MAGVRSYWAGIAMAMDYRCGRSDSLTLLATACCCIKSARRNLFVRVFFDFSSPLFFPLRLSPSLEISALSKHPGSTAALIAK